MLDRVPRACGIVGRPSERSVVHPCCFTEVEMRKNDKRPPSLSSPGMLVHAINATIHSEICQGILSGTNLPKAFNRADVTQVLSKILGVFVD